MFCARCGTPLPSTANFCTVCGLSQRQETGDSGGRTRWEFCQVRLTSVDDKLFRELDCFTANALSSSGRYVVAKSEPFRVRAAFNHSEDAESAFAAIVEELLATGWEPWQAPIEADRDSRIHEPWYLYRFRRKGRRQLPTPDVANRDHHEVSHGLDMIGGQEDDTEEVDCREMPTETTTVSHEGVFAESIFSPGDEWETCEIEMARSPFTEKGVFIAQTRSKGKSRLLRVTRTFDAESRERTAHAADALKKIVDDLIVDGWESVGVGSQWYSVRLRRQVIDIET